MFKVYFKDIHNHWNMILSILFNIITLSLKKKEYGMFLTCYWMFFMLYFVESELFTNFATIKHIIHNTKVSEFGYYS